MTRIRSIIDELNLPKDLISQFAALLISILVVHSIYLLFIRPEANLILEEAAQRNEAPPRTLVIVIKDYEQEACFVLFLWALSMVGLKWRNVMRERDYFDLDFNFIEAIDPHNRQTISDVQAEINEITGGDDNPALLPQCISASLDTFLLGSNLRDTAEEALLTCDTEADRMESELSMIRYIVWAIPSIGFLGTVRGIGDALAQAHEAVEGDIAGMTASLGVAFNSTFIALLISLILMFFLHQLQLGQDRLVHDTYSYCKKNLLPVLRLEDDSAQDEA